MMKPPHGHSGGGQNRPPGGRSGPRGSGGGRPPRFGPGPGAPNPNRPRGERPDTQGRPGGFTPRPQGQRPPDQGRREERPPQGGRGFAERPRHEGPPRDRGGARPPQAPAGTVWLYGQHAVAAALANPSRRLRRLLLTEEAEATLAQRLSPPWAIPHERVERGRIDQLLGRDAVHQGAALLADPLPQPSLAHTLERPGPLIVLDQVTDPRNVGAILRSAAAFGAAGVITQDRNAPDETGALAKAASGALETVPLLRAVNIARTLIALKAANCWVIGLDVGDVAPLSGAALAGRRVALVLGAEGTGLRRLTRETCDEVAGLTMKGAMESLNVSAAAAIALYEITRSA